MKIKKINLNWQSVLLGMALCMVLMVFLGNKIASPQIANTMQPGTIQRAANITDVWDRTIALEDRLIRVEKKIDNLMELVQETANKIHWMYNSQIKGNKK